MRNLYKYVRIYSGALPIFDEGDIFRLTVPLNAEHSPEAPDTPQKNGDTVVGETREKTGEKGTREKIIRFLVEKPSATQDDIAAMTGLSIKGIEWNLKVLKESGRIRRVGPDKGGHWEVIG